MHLFPELEKQVLNEFFDGKKKIELKFASASFQYFVTFAKYSGIVIFQIKL